MSKEMEKLGEMFYDSDLIEGVVVFSLKDTYNMAVEDVNSGCSYIDIPSQMKIIDATVLLLKYFLPTPDFELWLSTRPTLEATEDV